MFGWVANIISPLAQWVYWTGKENGPAMGRKSRRTWRGLAVLGSVQFWGAVSLLGGLVSWWTYTT